MVHGRQSAASAKNDCHSKRNNQWRLHGETHYDPAPEPAMQSVNRAPDERAVNVRAGLWPQSLKLLDLSPAVRASHGVDRAFVCCEDEPGR